MTHSTAFTIGSDVSCSDGRCGQLRRIVVDPVARVLTHLVVEPKHRIGAGRLVPVELASVTPSGIRLTCTRAAFDALEHADEARFLPATSDVWGYAQQEVLLQPYYAGFRGMAMSGPGSTSGTRKTIDRIPLGEIELRRGDEVYATDGLIGRVQGLVIDSSDHHVTHVLLDEGHLWGKKRVAIPIHAVVELGSGVQLTLAKAEVQDLPDIGVATPCLTDDET